MKELKNVVLKLLAKQHGISEDKAADMLFPKSEDDNTKLDFTKLKDSALTDLLNLDAKRVTTIKDSIDKTETYTKAYDKAKKEVLGKAEKALASTYGIDYVEGKTKLDSLVKNIVKKSIPADKAGELTDDNIKKSQLYIELENSKAKELELLKTTHKTALEDLEKGQKRAETLAGAKANAGRFFDALNPILSKDTNKALNQRNGFLRNFESFDYEKQKDGSHILINKADGKRVEDKHGHAVTLESKVNELANLSYDFKVQDDKGGAGDEGKGGGAAGKVNTPKDDEAYQKALFEAPNMEEREKITAAYEAGKE